MSGSRLRWQGNSLNGSVEIVWPDYSRCASNLVCSILYHYGILPRHPTLPELDRYLNRGYRNVVLLILDGLGSETLKEVFPENGFLKKRRITDLSAVFPSTTTAATTSLRSAMNPVEHGWLGWTLYFKEYDKSVDIFTNRAQFSGEPAADVHIASTLMPLRSTVTEMVTRSGRAEGLSISAHDQIIAEDMPQIVSRVHEACVKPGKHYVYAYYGEPDSTMHRYGIHSEETNAVLRCLDSQVQELAEGLGPDTLLIVTADHGLVDTLPVYVEDHPELMGMLVRPPVMEPRAAVLYVKDELKSSFPRAFTDAFGKEAFLLTGSREVVDRGLFGTGLQMPGLMDLLGDYIAIAVGDRALNQRKMQHPLVGMHAGLTRREMLVPLIIAKE